VNRAQSNSSLISALSELDGKLIYIHTRKETFD